MPRIFYTADIIRPDGSDTDVYGEQCGPGHGATMESGWLSPDWSIWDVVESRNDAEPDTYGNDDGPMIDWVVSRLAHRVGLYANDNGNGTFYAADSDTDFRTGADCLIAAHVEAPPAILAAVSYTIAHKRELLRRA